MKIFLLDLWQDLQAKRLWPVAGFSGRAGRRPVVLSKSRRGPAAGRVQAVRKAPDPKDLKALASVKLDETGLDRGSSLDTFDPSDPFRPPKKIAKRSSEELGRAVDASRASPRAEAQPWRHRLDRRRRRRDGAATPARPAADDRRGAHPDADRPVPLRRGRDLHGQRPHAPHQGPRAARHAAQPGLPAAALPRRHAERRQRGLPRRLHAEGGRRGQVQAQAPASARSSTSARAPSTSSPTTTATRTRLQIDEIRKVRVDGSAAAASRKKNATTARARWAPRKPSAVSPPR